MNLDVRRLGARRLIVGGAALALAVWVLGFASRGLFSGDSGVKLAQAHALWDSGFSSRGLPYDHTLDPRGRYVPLDVDPPQFVFTINGERQGMYSITFTAMAAPLIGLFGLTGMMLSGLAGGIMILVGIDRIGGRMGLSDPARIGAALVTVVLTPVLFYSGQFTEHTPAVGLTLLALSLVLDGGRVRPLLAGALAGAAATLRPECYIAVATLGVVLVARAGGALRPRIAAGAVYIAGALAVLLPFWGLNVLLSGMWDPGVAFLQPAPLSGLNMRKLLIGWIRTPGALWLAILGAGIAAGVAAHPRVPLSITVAIRVVFGLTIAWLGWQFRALATDLPPIGMFAVTPLAAYGLAASAWEPRWHPVWLFALLTTAGIVVLNKSPDAGGLQLGARLLLPALPALLLLAAAIVEADARALRMSRIRAIGLLAPAALLASTILIFVSGFRTSYQIAERGAVAAAAASSSPAPVVVTTVWWESQVLAPVLLADKQLYYARGDLRGFLNACGAQGITQVLVVDKQPPAEFGLSSGRTVHTVRTYKAWRTFHEVEIR